MLFHFDFISIEKMIKVMYIRVGLCWIYFFCLVQFESIIMKYIEIFKAIKLLNKYNLNSCEITP